MNREQRIAAFRRLLGERILVLDGAMGTMLQAYEMDEGAYRGATQDPRAGRAGPIEAPRGGTSISVSS